MEIILGRARRRWSEDEKRALVAETFVDGATVRYLSTSPVATGAQIRYPAGSRLHPGDPTGQMTSQCRNAQAV